MHPQNCGTCKTCCPYNFVKSDDERELSFDERVRYGNIRTHTRKRGCASWSNYQCGDECKGECSGEVDGITHCPVSNGQPQQGYIITEEKLDVLEELTDSKFVAEIRSHPYQSERNMNPICGSAECLNIIKPHETRVARVERDKVLDDVPLKALKSVIGLAFSFPRLPEEVRNHLIEVDNFYHKVKELQQKDGDELK
jgi:hypothetical protein